MCCWPTALTLLPWQGCAIITLDKAFLFTDGRYFLQAEKQLDEYVSVCLLLSGTNAFAGIGR